MYTIGIIYLIEKLRKLGIIHHMIYKNKRHLLSEIIQKNDIVLDIGFCGQGVTSSNPEWPHAVIKEQAGEVYGVDIILPTEYLTDTIHYKQISAEHISFDDVMFDKIFAGDLIEHLTNPGLFLNACRNLLKKNGQLILTTPNTFNLFNLAEKITKYEPTVNPDHTFYFNTKVLRVLLQKCGFTVTAIAYVYHLDMHHKESWKKKFLNMLYALLSLVTDKFMETLVIVAEIKNTEETTKTKN